MTIRTKLECVFLKGEDDYINTGVRPIEVYHTYNNATLAFELYGNELRFQLKELPFEPQAKFTICHVCHDEEPGSELEYNSRSDGGH